MFVQQVSKKVAVRQMSVMFRCSGSVSMATTPQIVKPRCCRW